ncbi:MAG: hypothetical protein ACW98D_21310 [Promethearchaeota archaeon]|jgi:hypothetical protein
MKPDFEKWMEEDGWDFRSNNLINQFAEEYAEQEAIGFYNWLNFDLEFEEYIELLEPNGEVDLEKAYQKFKDN